MTELSDADAGRAGSSSIVDRVEAPVTPRNTRLMSSYNLFYRIQAISDYRIQAIPDLDPGWSQDSQGA
jgi:hypothetical protein